MAGPSPYLGGYSSDLVACSSCASALRFGLPVEAYNMPSLHEILLSFVCVVGLSFWLLQHVPYYVIVVL